MGFAENPENRIEVSERVAGHSCGPPHFWTYLAYLQRVRFGCLYSVPHFLRSSYVFNMDATMGASVYLLKTFVVKISLRLLMKFA